MATLAEFAEKITALKAQLKAEGKEALTAAFKVFFDAHPMAGKIAWVQYTPYFNDGDACTFSVHEICLKLNPAKCEPDVQKILDEDYDDESAYDSDTDILTHIQTPVSWSDPCKKHGLDNRSLTNAEGSLIKEFKSLVKQCQPLEELFLEVFGDHVKVIATPSEITVEEYDHD